MLRRVRTKFFRKNILSCPPKGLRISIMSPSDKDSDHFRRLQWGDYWVKYELIRAFGNRGYCITDKDPDVIIHLFGMPAKMPRRAFKILWIYSHPERVDPGLLKKYDRIFCLSSSFNEKIKGWGFDPEVLYGATAKKYYRTDEYKYDVLFVGNNRLKGMRQIIKDAGDLPYDLKVWGKGWEGSIDSRYFGGHYIDYPDINEHYAASKITLNDHQEHMRTEGFVAVRIFDVLASGGFCISDKNPGIREIFAGCVPQYESAEHLREMVDHYMKNEEERQGLMRQGREIVSEYTWEGVAGKFISCFPEGNDSRN